MKSTVDLTVIAPARNEEDNIEDLVEEIGKALETSDLKFECIIIDDLSEDGTREQIRLAARRHPWLRGFALGPPDTTGRGQSAAFYVGVRQARGDYLALLDADRQNDPRDIPPMLKLAMESGADMIQGDRSANRRDSGLRRVSSWTGRMFRRAVLGDTIRDTGCSLRVMRREVALELPCRFAGAHRFIPFYTRMLGYRVIETPVNHRPRTAGTSKYGVWNRAIPGLIDLLAFRWMRSRHRPADFVPLTPSDAG